MSEVSSGTTGDEGPGRDDRRRWGWPRGIAVAGVVLLGLAGVVWVLMQPEEAETTYTTETRGSFLAACSADGGEEVLPVCRCWYDAIERSIPYARYDEVNRRLLAEDRVPGEVLDLPEDFAGLLEACRVTG